MKYKHILVALELSEDSKVLIDRAVSLAKTMGSEISFVHMDGTHGEIYPDLIDITTGVEDIPLKQNSIDQLRNFESYTDFPIKRFFVGTGDLSNKLHETITDNDVDLLICGHHHDFWSSIVSYSKHLINKSPVDILIVPI
ncbi:universal stress protein [uncultured Vibrio sp.]|uniref:universal stress protein n=1 Tax=uncultured Vibrio sp. TaxID=114054 RepID=UPI0025FA1879|nr:universal stress protein [uncultured Vibrio sp.]